MSIRWRVILQQLVIAASILIVGAIANDRMDGGSSADYLTGGAGNDRMTGGEGDDTFLFRSGSGRDVITDFSTTNDKIGIDVTGVDDFPRPLVGWGRSSQDHIAWREPVLSVG